MKKLLKTLLALLLVIILAAGGYVIYVLSAYYRIEDNLTLSVNGEGSAELCENTPYRIATYNVGFGAYSADYSFFMDGGVYSRAYSADAAKENILTAAAAASTAEECPATSTADSHPRGAL